MHHPEWLIKPHPTNVFMPDTQCFALCTLDEKYQALAGATMGIGMLAMFSR